MRILDFFRSSPDERIARRYIEILREVGESARLEYLAAERVVVSYDEKGKRVQLRYIGNLAREVTKAVADARDDIYRRYALSTMETPQDRSTYELVRSRLRVLLKDSSYPEVLDLRNRHDFPDGTPSPPLVFEPVAGDVIACCIEESEHALRFVRQTDLAEWGVDSQTALSHAKANVCALPFTISDPLPARYVLDDDSYIAARFVNPRMFDGLAVKGEWVAVIPDRDTFFIADSADPDAVAGLARLALRQLESGERIISGLPFVLRAGAWHVYEPPEPLRSEFRKVALQYSLAGWIEFKSVLEKDLASRGEDVFVAGMQVYAEADDDSHFSMAVWTRDVDTILPAVDRLYFSDGDVTRFALWHDVLRVMGADMRRVPGWPERYRVSIFPTGEQWVAMGAKLV